ncbi:CHAP domain-containing protein [Leuconostoc mesenteroides]|uniref:CHAP domain-containing protein n=1 Tax=Leuconostoc mesenteroides TaxID=1245 RepID=UPI00235DCF6D|nr:CHAP domain-containing protein [Leuconostoc mesenteroides]
MAKQIVNEMATNLTLDSNSASQALKELTREVKNSSTEAKILESQYKASGDAVSASKAKYEGLQSTLEAQKTKIEALKSGLDNVNTSTKKGQDLQQYLNGELAKAERQYASYQGQLEKATQSYKYQESGLSDLNKELKHSNDMTDARVAKLEAEGKQEEASKVKLEGLKTAQENYSKQLKIQQNELSDLETKTDKSSDAYKRQALRVEQTSAKLSGATRDVKEFANSGSQVEESTGHISKFKDKVGELGGAFVPAAAGVTALVSGSVSLVNTIVDNANKVSGLQARTTLSFSESKQAVKDINELYAQGYGDSLDELQETYQLVQQLNQNDSPGQLIEKTKLASTYAQQSGADITEVLNGASGATKNLGISYEDYFDLMSTASKKGLDAQGSLSDEMSEYSQVLGQMGFKASDVFGLLENGMKSGAYNTDKLLDFTKEFSISLNDGRMDESIGSFSKKTQDMFDGYKKGKVTSADMLKAVTGDLSGMTDKQKEATVASNLWSALGEDNALKVVESVGKANSSFADVGGTAKKTADQLKDSNPFDLAKRSAEAFTGSLTINKDQAKELKKAFEPLGKALKDLFQSVMKNLPDIARNLTPIIKFASKHLPEMITLMSILGGLWATKKVVEYGKAVTGVFSGLSGLIIKPKVDGSNAKRELGILGKAGKGIGKAFWWTGKLAIKSVLKSLELIGDATIKTGKALWWTAKLATKVFLKSLELLGGAVIKIGKAIGKGLVFTAKIATKGAKLAMAGLVKTAKATGKGIKLAFNFLKANPLILLVTAITAVVVSFVELYKHNKKFRKFVNDLVKSAQQFFKGIGKWFVKAYKTIMNFFKGILNFVKKDWKEILLFIVNPFAGAFALVYKHNAKFRKAVNNLVKNVVNFFRDMGKSIGNTFNSIFKNISKIYNSIKDFIGDTTHNIYKGWVNSWKSIFNFFGDTWNNIKKFGSNSINSLKGTFDDILGKIGKSFSNTWNGIKDGFKSMWEGMKQLAGDGINAVIKIPNAGIDGINGLIHDFGGPKKALDKIPKVKFANGTGAIQELTHAVLNDGNDSPETGNKETLVHPNGRMELVQGRNTERLLLPGTEVLNARETAMFMGLQGVKHFAGGTGFWSKLLSGAGNAVSNIAGSAWSGLKNGVDKFTKMLSYITGAVADPSGTLGKVLNLKSGGVSSVMDGVAGGAYKKVTSTAKDWWSTLWSMASESSSSGTGSKGDDYAYKNKSKDSGVDPWGYFYRECVSFVASRLKNLGVSASLFSHLGNGADWVNAKVPHSKTPKAGDVAVYGAGSEFGNHVAMVTGVQGDKISGEEYNWSGDGQYHTYNGRKASGATTFLDFGRSAGAKAKEVATNNPLSKLIKKQTGGMMEWIQKFIAPINDSSTGADNDVQSWSGDVKKALSKLGLSTSGSMVSKVLKQIQTESSGNAKAIGGNDGLADGNATGLMQVKPGTFKAYAVDGHNNIMNGYDNILAGLNYAKHTYGNNLSFLGQGHGYANGGLITKHQIAEIGEGNKPEMIIPLDGMKSSRGFELLGKTAVAMAQRDGLTGSSATSDSSTLEAKIEQGNHLLSNVVELLAGILGQTTEANQSVDDITMNKFSKAIINKAVRSVN